MKNVCFVFVLVMVLMATSAFAEVRVEDHLCGGETCALTTAIVVEGENKDGVLYESSVVVSAQEPEATGWRVKISDKTIKMKDGKLRISKRKGKIRIDILSAGKIVDKWQGNAKSLTIWHNVKTTT